MASKDYPRIPAKTWWTLRMHFKKSMPPNVSINYLATLLNISERAAMNYLPHFKLVKIIDEDDKTHELTSRWRDDDEYKSVCEEIKSEIYPNELQSLVPDPAEGFNQAVSWFMRDTGVGEAAAKQMARFYQLISKADVSDGAEALKGPSAKKGNKSAKTNKTNGTGRKGVQKKSSEERSKKDRNGSKSFKFRPSVNINVQIHISPDASTEQIDDIFKSMSNHFSKLAVENE